MFPSRLGLGSGSQGTTLGNDKVLLQQMKEIKNIFRRVYRIYAHAWFQHREMFWRVEGKTGLYVFFKMVCDEYGIIESENYTIPPEAEGLEPEKVEEVQAPMSVLKRDSQEDAGEVLGQQEEKAAGNSGMGMGDTTKRHRHTMSDLSSSVNTVIQEEVEEEEEPEEKPGVDLQATAQKDFAEFPSEPTEELKEEDDDAEEDDEPVPGIARSDTMKPTRVAEESSAEEEGEQTVVETTTEEEEKTTEEGDGQAETETESETAEPFQEQLAAEPKEAGETVGD